MKKLFTILAVLFMAQLSFGQTVLLEDFTGTAMPPAGWSYDGLPAQWSRSATANAGGVAAEAKFTYINQVNTSRFVSPVLDLTATPNLTLQFKYFYDYYAGGPQIGVATREGTTGAWNIVWQVTPNGNQGPKTQVVDLTNVGQANIQFCFFITGNLYNVDYWFLDDIKLFKRENLDGMLATVNIPNYFIGDQTISGQIINEGLTAITSIDINWTLNDGPVNNTSLSGINIATGATYNYTSSQILNAPPGMHDFKIWISNVNGVTVDDNPANDMIQKAIGVPTEVMQRRPLFEEFTSSTCAPCASFNNATFNPFIAQNGESIALIKYQMSWPAPGDPYYTAEGGVRRTYYGVNAVPMLYAEGKNVATNTGAVNTAFNNAMSDPAFVLINGTHEISGTTITVNAEITPYVALTNATVHVVVIEKLTTNNTGNNGETSFHHVMMKMLPDANGTTMNMASGVVSTLNFTQDLATTNVEQMDDLAVVIFVQDNSTKYVFQAAYTQDAAMVAATVSFDPINGATGITTEADLYINFNMPVAKVGGDAITNANVAELVTLNAQGGSVFPFTATINDEKTMITVSPNGLLNSYTMYEFGIGEVQNENAVITPASMITFETGMHVGVSELNNQVRMQISPNPVKDNVNIVYTLETASNISMALYDMNGKMIEVLASGDQIAGRHELNYQPSSNLPNGVYFVRLNTASNSGITKLFINR